MPVYLELLHGRKSPDEKLDGWGFDGPILGPLGYVHTTYNTCIHLGEPDGSDSICDVSYVEDLLFYDGAYYGDVSVIDGDALAGLLKARPGLKVEHPDEKKATPPRRHNPSLPDYKGTKTLGGRVVGSDCAACWTPVVAFDDHSNRPCGWCACEFPDDENEMLLKPARAARR